MMETTSLFRYGCRAIAAALLLAPWGASVSLAQTTIPPFFTDFSEGIPVGWEREVGGGVAWEENDTLGVADTGALVVDMAFSSDRDTTWLRTGEFSLETIANPVLTMNIALVNANFLPPVLSLWFETREGEWQRLTGWGPQFSEEPTIPIENSNNHFQTLMQGNVRMVEVAYPLVGLSWRQDIRFELRAEMINGGWLILDNFRIESGESSGVEVEQIAPEGVDLQ